MIVNVDDEEKEPDDWDDMEDGEWEALMKYSPAYEGVWEAERIANTEFEGHDIVYRYDYFRSSTWSSRTTIWSTDIMALVSLISTCGRREAVEYSTALLPIAKARRIR